MCCQGCAPIDKFGSAETAQLRLNVTVLGEKSWKLILHDPARDNKLYIAISINPSKPRNTVHITLPSSVPGQLMTTPIFNLSSSESLFPLYAGHH